MSKHRTFSKGFDFKACWLVYRTISKGEPPAAAGISLDKSSAHTTGSATASAIQRKLRKITQHTVVREVGAVLLMLAFFVWLFMAGLHASIPTIESAIQVMNLGIFLLMLLMGIYTALSELFFAKDASYYLALPIDGSVITWARFAHYLLGVTAGSVLLLGFPCGVAYGLGLGPASYFYAAFAFLTTSFSIGVLITLILLVLMRFAKFVHNKERFMTVLSVFMLVLAIGVGIGAQFLVYGDSEVDVFAAVGGFIDNPMQKAWMLIVSPSTPFIGGFFSGNPGQVALSILVPLLVCAIYVLALSFLSKAWYISILRTLTMGSTTKKRKLSQQEMQQSFCVRAPWRALLKQDLLRSKRDPTMFTGVILAQLCMPVYFVAILVVVVVLSFQRDEIPFDQALTTVQTMAATVDLGSLHFSVAFAILMGVLLFGPATSAGSLVANISRDGQDFFFIRATPTSMKSYLLSKYLFAVLFGVLPSLVVLVALLAIIQSPVLPALYMVVGYILLSLANQQILLVMASYFTKFNFTSTRELLKGGAALGRVYGGMLASIAISALPIFVVVVPLIWSHVYSTEVGLILFFVVVILELAILSVILVKYAPKHLAKLES